jgi:hypothetical protein
MLMTLPGDADADGADREAEGAALDTDWLGVATGGSEMLRCEDEPPTQSSNEATYATSSAQAANATRCVRVKRMARAS